MTNTNFSVRASQAVFMYVIFHRQVSWTAGARKGKGCIRRFQQVVLAGAFYQILLSILNSMHRYGFTTNFHVPNTFVLKKKS